MDCWMKFLWTTDFGIPLKLYQHIFYKENEISISYDPNYQKEIKDETHLLKTLVMQA